MLEVRLRLLDHNRDAVHSLMEITNPFVGGIEVARDEKVEAVGQTLIVNERVPVRVAQFFQSENFAVDVVAQNSHVHLICAGQLFVIVKFLERFANLLRVHEHARARLRRVIG